MNQTKAAIIGAGPAGISCALQLKRYGLKPLIFEKNQIGGLLRNANLVENYMGFEEGISGRDLVEKFRKNLEKLNISPMFAEVKNISFIDGYFNIEANNNLFKSEILVVASGTKPKKTELQINKSLQDKIYYEIADLPENNYSGKKFAIIGAGDAAFDYALNLVNNFNALEIVVLNRAQKAKSLELLEERALKTGKIKHIKNISVNKIEETDGKIILSCIKGEDNLNVDADYLISAIGREPCLDFLNPELLKDSSDLENTGLLYFIGDVINGEYRQTSIAAGNGIQTAMKIYNKY